MNELNFCVMFSFVKSVTKAVIPVVSFMTEIRL